ncbi:MAG: M20 family metallopeptidase [Planctomycetaceae bacterium]|nr:M20 family metallopeptidase [Planctomycetaceae bacterium]
MTALDYAWEMIRFDSVSARSNVAVTDYVEDVLRRLNLEVERLEYDDEHGVRKANVVGKLGTGVGGLAYFGHTDVVPADDWCFTEHGPFDPTVRDGRLYGRGSTDMKGSVACMLAAVEQLRRCTLNRPVYVTCTADEEIGMGGAEYVATHSELYREMVTGDARAIIGEPTSLRVVHGHKGGCAYRITSRGRAAHSSTGKGTNANWRMIPFLQAMAVLNDELEHDPQWRHEEFNPPTMTMNLGINDHTHAINITPPHSVCTVYFRPMPGMDISPLTERIESLAHDLGLECESRLRSEPLYADPRSEFVQECLELTGTAASHTVPYGTDGARFGSLRNRLVIGPGDIAQAHTHDEWIELAQLDAGTDLYMRMIERWCM